MVSPRMTTAGEQLCQRDPARLKVAAWFGLGLPTSCYAARSGLTRAARDLDLALALDCVAHLAW
jgi:hypothetical protein